MNTSNCTPLKLAEARVKCFVMYSESILKHLEATGAMSSNTDLGSDARSIRNLIEQIRIEKAAS